MTAEKKTLKLFGSGFLLSIFFGLALSNCSTQTKNESFTIQRGTNISHWLSQSSRRGEERSAWFIKKDVEFLAGIGFDHLRIPIDEEQMWNEDGSKEAEAFQLLNNSLDWCAEYNLRAIVDLHILRSHHFNAKVKPLWTEPAAKERFFQNWRDLSAELEKRPVSMVAYELMNEAVADDPEDWNKLIEKAVAVIRENEPDRVIVIGSNRWQSADTFDELRLPENDPHILLSFHMYEPFALTHHTASWTNIRDYDGPVHYPGVTVQETDLKEFSVEVQKALKGQVRHYDKDSILKHFEKPLALTKETDLPLYCGEWGCLPTVPEEDRKQWYRDMRAVLESSGFAWATWDYKGGFGIVDKDGAPVQNLIDVLLK